MRDPKRIDRVISLLREAWHLAPDFRFWQLINALEFGDKKGDPFFWEDDEWEEIFRNTIESFTTHLAPKQ